MLIKLFIYFYISCIVHCILTFVQLQVSFDVVDPIYNMCITSICIATWHKLVYGCTFCLLLAPYKFMSSFCPFFMHLKFEYPFNKTFGWGDWDPKLHKILAKCHIACKHECYKQENKKIYVASWTFVDFVVLHTCSNANPLRSVNLTNIHIPKTPKCYFMYNMIMHFIKLLFMSPKEDA